MICKIFKNIDNSFAINTNDSTELAFEIISESFLEMKQIEYDEFSAWLEFNSICYSYKEAKNNKNEAYKDFEDASDLYDIFLEKTKGTDGWDNTKNYLYKIYCEKLKVHRQNVENVSLLLNDVKKSRDVLVETFSKNIKKLVFNDKIPLKKVQTYGSMLVFTQKWFRQNVLGGDSDLFTRFDKAKSDYITFCYNRSKK